MRAGSITLAAASLLMLTGALPLNVSAESFHASKQYYLAVEMGAGTYDPATSNTGYVDDLAAELAGIDPGIQIVSLSCPSQSSMSFHKKCAAGTFQCGRVCCDASGDLACVNGVCCVPPHCPR
jgi:hypothetical protein